MKQSTGVSKFYRLAILTLISALGFQAMAVFPINIPNGEPKVPGFFYGYQSSTSGNGDDGFKKCLALVRSAKRPMVLIWGKDSCTSCRNWVEMTDYFKKTFPGGLSKRNVVNAYFRGAESSPPAVKEAREFFDKPAGVPYDKGGGLGGAKAACHLIGFYGEYWDETTRTLKTYTQSTTLVTSGDNATMSEAFFSRVDAWIAAWEKLPQQPDVLATAEFAAPGELKAAPETKQVYAQLVRKYGFDTVENDRLVVKRPGALAETNLLEWAAGETVKEVCIDVNGSWTANGKIDMEIIDENDVVTETDAISFVNKPANGFGFPALEGATFGKVTVDYAAATGLVFAANAYQQPDTNALDDVSFEISQDWSTSNRYDTVYTDDITVFRKDEVAFDHEFAFSVSNVNTVVHTNDLQFFTKLGEFEDFGNAACVEVVVTNTITTRYASSLSFRNNETNVVPVEISVEATNTVYRVMPNDGGDAGATTNKWSEMAFTATSSVAATNIVQYAIVSSNHGDGDETVETNLVNVSISAVGTNIFYLGVSELPAPNDIERKFASGDFVTNCVYTVVESENGPVTNDYRMLSGTWQPVSLEFTAAATEFTTYMLTETLDGEIPEAVSTDSGEGAAETTFRVSDVATFYFAESNDFTTANADFSFAASNSVSYVFNGGADTNIDANAYVLVTTNLATVTTNFVSVRLADNDHPVGTTTEYRDFEQRLFTIVYTNSYYSVETNSYQYGISGSSEEPSKAFTLVVNGGIVWDDALVALDASVFSSQRFAAWCGEKQVALVYLDVPEPGTGASLFSCNVASNGNSGASFMSIAGLSAAEGATLAEQAAADAEALFGGRGATALPGTRDACPYQIALVRPDGSVCGRLRPQFNADGTCDLNENMARLDELVAQAADLDEAANDTPVGDGLGATALSYGEEGTGTLSVNDVIDCFMLAGDEWAGKKIAFSISAHGADGAQAAAPLEADPDVLVLRLDETGGYEEADYEISVFATNGVRDVEFVYSFDQADIAAGRIFVAAAAYAGEDAASARFGGKSAIEYAISAYEATPNPGIVSFDAQPDTAIIQEPEDQTIDVPLYRIFGSDGPVSVNVMVDEAMTTATGRYEFVTTNLVWADGETGVKTVPLTLKGSEYNDGLYDIVLRIEEVEAMAGLEKYYTTYTISYGKEPTEEGQMAVVSVEPAPRADGRVYVRRVDGGALHADDMISVQINRTGGKGPAAAYIGWKNGRDAMRETLAWANYLTGMQTAFLSEGFPEPGKSGYTDVTVTVTSSNSVPMVKEGSVVKVRVLPADAPLFDDQDVEWSGVQYTMTSTNLTSIAIPQGASVKSLAKISGTVPAGLKVSLVDGNLAVTGTPTAGTVSSVAVYWVTLARDDGGALCSMPVTVTFGNKALADVNDGFSKARSWTGLPLLETSQSGSRLAGLLDLTVAKNGKTSARCRMAGGKTVTFSAPGLAGVDADGNVSLRAEKVTRVGGASVTNTFEAVLGADGSLEATVLCGDGALAASLPAGSEPWSADRTAEAFGGNYVAAFPLGAETNANTLCLGATSMRLKADALGAWKRGTVTFAGWLPNGKYLSGTATLAPVADGAQSASLPIFASSASDTFSAMVDLNGAQLAATDGVTPFWRHDESGIEPLSYENGLDVVGALWSWADWNWTGEKVNVNKTSGIASGAMRLGDGRTVQWKGVALPGDTPKILGAYWYNATMPYKDGNGTDRKRTVRVGGPVALPEE